MAAPDAKSGPDASGKTPDLRVASAPPLDLPRLVMRRSLVVALGFLLLALVLGLLAARRDTQQEIEGALALARMTERLQELPADDAQALASLQFLGSLRHLQVRIADAQGQVLLHSATSSPPAPLRWLMEQGRRVGVSPTGQTVSWSVERPDGAAWTVLLTAMPDSEQREALTNLLGLFALLAGCSLLMLAVMHWNVRHALRPLQALLTAIARVERQDLAGVKALPPMPIRELDAMATALKSLAASLEQAEEARRVLAHKLLTLQEDERQRLARDLHDEFGQRLTALRVNAAWLHKRLAGDTTMEPVVAEMSEQISHIQHDVRDMLAHLQPLGGATNGDGSAATESGARLRALLEALTTSWSAPNTGGVQCELRLSRGRARNGAPDVAALDGLRLPRDLVLAVHRMSQEALTNAARHAGARHARIDVHVDDSAPGLAVLHWSARDDGSGLTHPETAMQRGNGLAGIKERVWALGGEFSWTATNPPPMRGMQLRARLACALTEPTQAATT